MPARRVTHPDIDDTAAWHPQPGQWTSMLFDVFVLGQRTRALVNEVMRDAGLRPDEYATYSVVFERRAITLTEMAELLGMPVTTVAEYVRAMRERGHLRSKTHPTDQRARLLALTPSGLRLHRQASRAFERAHQAFMQELGPLDEGPTREVLQRLAGSAERALDSLPVRRVS